MQGQWILSNSKQRRGWFVWYSKTQVFWTWFLLRLEHLIGHTELRHLSGFRRYSNISSREKYWKRWVSEWKLTDFVVFRFATIAVSCRRLLLLFVHCKTGPKQNKLIHVPKGNQNVSIDNHWTHLWSDLSTDGRINNSFWNGTSLWEKDFKYWTEGRVSGFHKCYYAYPQLFLIFFLFSLFFFCVCVSFSFLLQREEDLVPRQRTFSS